MKVFKDIMSNSDQNYMDELFTDAKPVENDDGDVNYKGFWRIPVKRISEKTDIDESVYGGNASAEAEDAGDTAEAYVATGIDVVIHQGLVSFDFFHESATKAEGKKKFQNEYFKPFSKALIGKLSKEKADEYKKTAPLMLKFIKDNWSDLAFYAGKTLDSGAAEKHSLCFVTYGPDGFEDYMYFNKFALLEEKV